MPIVIRSVPQSVTDEVRRWISIGTPARVAWATTLHDCILGIRDWACDDYYAADAGYVIDTRDPEPLATAARRLSNALDERCFRRELCEAARTELSNELKRWGDADTPPLPQPDYKPVLEAVRAYLDSVQWLPAGNVSPTLMLLGLAWDAYAATSPSRPQPAPDAVRQVPEPP